MNRLILQCSAGRGKLRVKYQGGEVVIVIDEKEIAKMMYQSAMKNIDDPLLCNMLGPPSCVTSTPQDTIVAI